MLFRSFYRRHPSVATGKHGWIASSGAKGLRELKLKLTKGEARRYTVRLYFAEPDDIQVGQRIFDVELQGRRVEGNLDILKEAGSPWRTLVKEFKDVEVRGELLLRLTPARNATVRTTILCGLEVVAEDKK